MSIIYFVSIIIPIIRNKFYIFADVSEDDIPVRGNLSKTYTYF